MNLLVIPYYNVYPITLGSGIAQIAPLKYLSNYCNIHLAFSEHYTPSLKDIDSLHEYLPKVKLHYLESSLKKEIRQSVLTLQINKAIFELKKNLTKNKCKRLKIDTDRMTDFENFFCKYNPYHLHTPDFVEFVKKIINENSIDIVQLEMVENLSLITIIPPEVKKVYINHESRFLHMKSFVKAREMTSKFSDYVTNFNKIIELGLIKNFDAVISFKESDSQKIEANIKEESNDLIKTVFASIPFPVLDSEFEVLDDVSLSHFNKLIFIGPEEHLPNKDGVEWFISHVANDVYEIFKLPLHVIGNWSPRTIGKYNVDSSRVKFTGFVENLSEYTKNSICVVPTRIGGGLKTKILLSMAKGVPVICTAYALDGIEANHMVDVLIADNKDEFLIAIEFLINNREKAISISKNAQKLVREKYSQLEIAKKRLALYNSLFH